MITFSILWTISTVLYLTHGQHWFYNCYNDIRDELTLAWLVASYLYATLLAIGIIVLIIKYLP